MTVQHPWARHYQTVWHERAGDPRLPYWLRVAALAYGSHAANGHAVFKPGQVALVLGRVDSTSGEVRPLDKGSVQRAIRAAAENGWLAPQSGSRCLVVPSHAVTGGVGSADGRCPIHDVRRGQSVTPRSATRVTEVCISRQGTGAGVDDLENTGRHPAPTQRPKVGTQCPPGRRSVPTDNALTSSDPTALYESSLDLSADESDTSEEAS